jgi:co-chaperonin GroES (HSP10)
MYKIKPMNRKVLVEKIASAEANDNFANDYGIVVPKLESISKKRALSEGKYLFRVIASNNPTIKENMIILSDTANMEEYNFTIVNTQYNLLFIDELDILALFEDET